MMLVVVAVVILLLAVGVWYWYSSSGFTVAPVVLNPQSTYVLRR